MTEEEDVIRNRGVENLLTAVEDPYEMDRAAEQDFWNGPGHIELYVHANRPDVFEIEIVEYTGCVGGMGEGCGIEFYLESYWDIQNFVKEGRTYIFEGITVHWIRGDGWTTDDDVEYDYGAYTETLELVSFLKTKLSNLWWFSLGYRIRNFQTNRKKGTK